MNDAFLRSAAFLVLAAGLLIVAQGTTRYLRRRGPGAPRAVDDALIRSIIYASMCLVVFVLLQGARSFQGQRNDAQAIGEAVAAAIERGRPEPSSPGATVPNLTNGEVLERLEQLRQDVQSTGATAEQTGRAIVTAIRESRSSVSPDAALPPLPSPEATIPASLLLFLLALLLRVVGQKATNSWWREAANILSMASLVVSMLSLVVAILGLQQMPGNGPQPTMNARVRIFRTAVDFPAFSPGSALTVDPERNGDLQGTVCKARALLARDGATAAIVLSGYDHRELIREAARQFGSNYALGQQRGDTIEEMLKNPTCDATPITAWVVVRGPKTTDVRAFKGQPRALELALAADRTVELLGVSVDVSSDR